MPSGHGTDIEVAVRSWRRAPLAAVAWLAPDGTPDAASVFPLTEDARPTLALPYSQLALARALEVSTEVVLAVPGPSAGSDALPVLVRGRAEVIADPKGRRFHDRGLIDAELAKYPTSRRRLDSLLLRREHWWFLPRLIVRLTALHDARTVETMEAVLATGGTGLEVDGCHLDDRDPLVLRPAARLSGRRPAVVLEYGGDVPELEWPWECRWRGTLDGDRFETEHVIGGSPDRTTMTLRQRMRTERRLERACRAGLRAAGHG